jgi:hypothetical protein
MKPHQNFLHPTGGNSKGIVSLNSAFEKPIVNHPSIMNSNTITCLKIISGLQNKLKNFWRLPVCSNKQFEEGYWKDFHN